MFIFTPNTLIESAKVNANFDEVVDRFNLLEASGSYSIDEIKTGYKWIDGKDIYKKTYSTGALPNATTVTVAHNLTGISQFIDIKGLSYSATTSIPLPFVSTTAANCVMIYEASGNIVISAGIDRQAFATTYITLWYTRT